MSGLIDIGNFLYYNTIDKTPLREFPMFSTFSVSFACAYGITKGIEWASKKFTPNFYNNYLRKIESNIDEYMPKIFLAGALIYNIVYPEEAKYLVMHIQHPVALAGVSGGLIGGYRAVHRNVKKETKTEKLEKIIDSNSTNS